MVFHRVSLFNLIPSIQCDNAYAFRTLRPTLGKRQFGGVLRPASTHFYVKQRTP
jgi:hypothetical protein